MGKFGGPGTPILRKATARGLPPWRPSTPTTKTCRRRQIAWMGHGESVPRSKAHGDLFFADVLVPDFGMLGDEGREEVATLLAVEVNDGHAVLAQPVETAGKGAAFAHHDGADAELADQPRAVPAGGEGGDHDDVAVAALPAGAPEGVGLAMDARVTLLHAAVVAPAHEFAGLAEHGGADGNSAL